MVIDASEDEGKVQSVAARDNVVAARDNVANTDSKASSVDSSQKRQMSVREKAAAFLENANKDSVC